MLPDFPSLKEDLDRLLQLGASTQASSMARGAIKLPRRRVCEGDRYTLVREDGTVVEKAFDTVSATEYPEVRVVETLNAPNKTAALTPADQGTPEIEERLVNVGSPLVAHL